MESRYANTLSRSGDLARSLKLDRPLSEKLLASSRSSISSQLMNVYMQQKEITLNTFDSWSHEQKTNFLLSLLPHANYRQLVHVVNWFQDNIPVWCLDFTTVLPRFLSLYIFSFLDTKSLARASTVCWRWKFITDQDVLWRERCLKLGWQLPFFPSENEYGAWKKYFAKTYRQLDELGLPIPVIGDIYPPFLNKFDPNHSLQTRVTMKSGSSVSMLRLTTDPMLYSSYTKRQHTVKEDELWISGAAEPTSLVLRDRAKLLSDVGINVSPGSLTEALAMENALEQRLGRLTAQDWQPPTPSSDTLNIMKTFSESDRLSPRKTNPAPAASAFPASYPAWLGQSIPACRNPRLVLISSQVPAAELLAVAVSWSSVEAIVYDFQGSTPDSLINDVTSLLGHRMAKSIAIVPSQSDSCLQSGFQLTGNCYVTPSTLESVNDQARRFFCVLGTVLLPRVTGGDGYVDLFTPLLMHEEGGKLLVKLNSATGLIFHCPQTARGDYEFLFGNCDWIVTKESVGLLERPLNESFSGNNSLSQSLPSGSYQNSLKKLSDKVPPKLYFEDNRLQFWLKTYRLLHRSVAKIRRDLEKTLEYRTESVLLERLVGQVAFEEFEGNEFSFALSAWPELSQAVAKAARSGLQESIGHGEDEDEQIEWRMAQMQSPAVAIAAKLLEQAGYCVRDKLPTLKQEKASQSQKQVPLIHKNIQTTSLYLPTTTTNAGSHEEKLSEHTAQSTTDNDDSSDDQKDAPPIQNIGESVPTVTSHDTDMDSLLLGEKAEHVTFKDAVGEEDAYSQANTSSGVVSSAKSDTSFRDEYPFDSSSGIRPIELNKQGNTVPVKLDVAWSIERSRIQDDLKHTFTNKKKGQASRMVYSVLFTEADRRLIAGRDLLEAESRYNKILNGVQTALVYPLNQAVFQDRSILSTNNIKMLFSDLMQLLDISNEFLEALEARLDNWVDVEGQLSDVILTFVCARWNIFLSYLNNYPVVLETLDRCCDEQRLFRSFLARNERTLPVGMLSLAELFVLPFDQLAAYRSHFRRIAAHTDPNHHDITGFREARKLMSQYCAVIAERAAGHAKRPFRADDSVRANEFASLSDEMGSTSTYGLYHKLNEPSSDLQLLRDCPFVLDVGSAGERRFVCRQDVTLMRPTSGKHVPFVLQLFEVVDEIGLFLFSDCLVVAKRRATHRPYVREADIAFQYANSVLTRELVQIDLPDTKYISFAAEYRSNQYRWIVVFADQQSKGRFMAIIAPYINSQLSPSPRVPSQTNTNFS